MLRSAAAAAPLLAVLALMVGARWPAARAGAVGAALAFVGGIAVFDLGGDRGVGAATAGIVAEALSTTAAILWIIAPALAIYRLQHETGAIDTLRDGLRRIADDPRLAALLVAWFFSLFLEGAAGFGTSAALAAPFLVALGFTPVQAVVAALLGHAAGVSFGAVGTPLVPQSTLGVDVPAITLTAALLHVAVSWVLLVGLARLLQRAVRGRPVWAWAALAAVAFFVPSLLLAAAVGPELPTLGGALIGGAAFAGVAATVTRRRSPDLALAGPGGDPVARATAPPRRVGAAQLLRASAPYLVLVGLVLLTRLVPPVRAVTTAVELAWSWEGFGFTFAPLHHPGTLLATAFAAGALAQGASRRQVVTAVAVVVRMLVPVTAALVAMLVLSRILVTAGMVGALAESAAGALGSGWLLLAPAVGALGTFVTGSATASNILLSDLQLATATQTGAPATTVLGAQTFGAAIGNTICPHNVVAAGATVGLDGEEGTVLRGTAPWALLTLALGGAAASAFAALGG